MDKEGKTPLMNPQLYDVAKTLIELGANMNAYHPGELLFDVCGHGYCCVVCLTFGSKFFQAVMMEHLCIMRQKGA